MDNEQQNSVSINVKLELKDFINFRKGTYFSSMLLVRVAIMFIIYLAIFSTLYSMYQIPTVSGDIGSNGTLDKIFIFVFSLIVSIVVVVATFFLKPLTIMLSSKRYFNSNKLLQQQMRYDFGDVSFNLNSESGSANIKWENLYKVNEYKEVFALFISRLQAYIIPKRCFENKEDMERFKEILRANIFSKKLRLRK